MYKNHLRYSLLLMFIISMSSMFSNEANATTFATINRDVLRANLGAIYMADVLRIDPKHGLNSSGKPTTRVAIRVTSVFAGDVSNGEVLEFFLPEGNIDETRLMIINNTAKFSVGASYLIMQRTGNWYQSPVFGWDGGYFRVIYSYGKGDYILVDNNGGCFLGLTNHGIWRSPSFMEPPYYTIGMNGDILIEERVQRHQEPNFNNDSLCLSIDEAETLLSSEFQTELRGRTLAFSSSKNDPSVSETAEADVEPEEEHHNEPPICSINPLLIQCSPTITYEE